MRKLTFNDVLQLCEDKNCTTLETEYKNCKTSIGFRCNVCSYEWYAKFHNVKRGKGCPSCNNQIKTKINFQTVLDLCRDRNWTTLETEYKNIFKIMKWKCNVCNYTWTSTIVNARNRTECRKCSSTGMVKYTLDEAKKVGEIRGFILRETEYKRSDIPMTWKCTECAYTWKTSLANVNRSHRGKGCPNCNGMPNYTIEMVKAIVKERDITCLENEYNDCNEPMKWRCNKCSREWTTTFRSLKQNIGCIKCTFKETVCLNLDIVEETIRDRDMVCLETEYVNTKIHMLWKCLKCHCEWKACFDHIRHCNSGCPNCASYKSERLCRQYFQEFMGVPFPTKRPKFLNGLEYDGYNKDLKLAFEYQGKQHYEHVQFFHKTEENFVKLQQSDKIKKKISKDHGICLIEIPYTYSQLKPDKLREFVFNQLIKYEFLVVMD